MQVLLRWIWSVYMKYVILFVILRIELKALGVLVEGKCTKFRK